jgi:hypothetical protein
MLASDRCHEEQTESPPSISKTKKNCEKSSKIETKQKISATWTTLTKIGSEPNVPETTRQANDINIKYTVYISCFLPDVGKCSVA